MTRKNPHDSRTAGNSPDKSILLEHVLSECIDRINKGEELDPGEIIRDYPDLAAELLLELETYQSIHSLEAPLEPLGTLGDYTLRRQIGRGGMGVVYDAWENSMDRRVALKVLPAGVAADTRAAPRFLREAQTAGKLSHPNVVPVYFTGVKEQTPFYAMLTGQSPRKLPHVRG